jgi:hypothetical protein
MRTVLRLTHATQEGEQREVLHFEQKIMPMNDAHQPALEYSRWPGLA